MELIKSVGIVAEYNPFHKGHLYHLKETVEQIAEGCDNVVSVVVISGNFTQRGEAAIFDKWTRAEMAVANGVDLVVELPVVFSCSSAGNFARGGVEILENLGVDYISFGSESGKMSELQMAAEILKKEDALIEAEIKAKVKEGVSYPRARQEVLTAYLEEEQMELISNPNNILALEYLKNMKNAQPFTVKRAGAGYNEMASSEGLASASYIRKCMGEGADVSQWVPEAAMNIMNGRQAVSMDRLFPMIVQKVLTTPAEELELVEAGGEGLGNRLKNSIRSCSSWEELVDALKSKRYTRTRVMRLLMHVLLDIREADIKEAKPYIRVLAFSPKGAKYLKAIKKSGKCALPVITNINKDVFPEVKSTLEKDILATDLYNLAMGRDLYKHSDFVECVRRG